MRFHKVGVTRRGMRRVVASGAIVALSGAAVIAVGSGANVGAEGNYVRTCLQGLGERNIAHLNAPLVDIVLTGTDHGCWLVGADGGVFSFGDAGYFGSAGGSPRANPIVTMQVTPGGDGYSLTDSTGKVYRFFDPAPSAESLARATTVALKIDGTAERKAAHKTARKATRVRVHIRH